MIIKDAKVFQNNTFTVKDIGIEGEYFSPVSAVSNQETLCADGLYAIPGLIDIHFHGCMGVDLCDADEEGLEKIAAYEAKNGILAICPATMTLPVDKLESVMTLCNAYSKKTTDPSLADLVGINMEGPFVSPERLGAQNPAYAKLPEESLFVRLQNLSGGLIRLLDLAPELPGAMECIEKLSGLVNISIAHTSASYEQACIALSKGARHITHLFNAMPGLHHRDPGPIAAAFEQGAELELIADGIHVSPPMIRLAFREAKEGKMILISDSMEATGLSDGMYQLGGQDVIVKGKKAVIAGNEEALAGSVTNLCDCLRYAVKEAGIPLESAVAAATINPARAIGIDERYGSINDGKFANLILMNRDLEIVHILHKGHVL